jgi:hypothetical protein
MNCEVKAEDNEPKSLKSYFVITKTFAGKNDSPEQRRVNSLGKTSRERHRIALFVISKVNVPPFVFEVQRRKDSDRERPKERNFQFLLTRSGFFPSRNNSFIFSVFNIYLMPILRSLDIISRCSSIIYCRTWMRKKWQQNLRFIWHD